MSPKSVRDLVMDYLAKNPGMTNGQKIANAIGRPGAQSTIYRILRDLRGETPTGVAPGSAGTTAGSQPPRDQYVRRGETRARIEKYLDDHPGTELSAQEMAETLGLNPSTVGKNMRVIIRQRNARAKSAKPKSAPDRKPQAGTEVAERTPQPARTQSGGNGVTALLLRLQAGNFADVPLPPEVLIRQPGGPHHRDGIARDAEGRIYELREL